MNERGPGQLALTAGRDVFGADAAGYHAGRIGYPEPLMQAIAEYCGGRPGTVLEIGPGTGLATRQLIEIGAERVAALEPDPVLATFLRETLPDERVEVLNGLFPDAIGTAFPAAAFDLVAAACSFHWIAPEIGLAGVRQALRPGGRVALWWNSYRHPDDPFFAILQPHLTRFPRPPMDRAGSYDFLDFDLQRERLSAAEFRGIEYHLFTATRTLDAAAMQALYASFSFVRMLPADDRADFLGLIGRIVDQDFGGSAPNLVRSPLYLANTP